MASDRAKLEVSPREQFGSRASRRLRREGMVPGIVYAGGKEARPFAVPERAAQTAMEHHSALMDVVIDGSKPIPAVVKEAQRHPVRGSLVHLDLYEVSLDTEIQSEVVIELLGGDDAPGVKAGGVLEHVTREVIVESLPTNIPDLLEVDVSEMEIGDTIQLSTVALPEGVRFVAEDLDEITVATLSPPKLSAEPELDDVEEEVELVGEEGEAAEEDGDAEQAPAAETDSGAE